MKTYLIALTQIKRRHTLPLIHKEVILLPYLGCRKVIDRQQHVEIVVPLDMFNNTRMMRRNRPDLGNNFIFLLCKAPFEPKNYSFLC